MNCIIILNQFYFFVLKTHGVDIIHIINSTIENKEEINRVKRNDIGFQIKLFSKYNIRSRVSRTSGRRHGCYGVMFLTV